MASGDNLTESDRRSEDNDSRIAFLRLSDPRPALSLVSEDLGEGSDLSQVEGQFSDAVEDSTIQDNASAKIETSSKRDSKLDDDQFRETASLPPIKEKPHELGEPVEIPEIAEQQEQERDDFEQQRNELNREDHTPTNTQSSSPVALSLLLLGICSAVLLVSLDRTIITTV
jgi:hypothetical protein